MRSFSMPFFLHELIRRNKASKNDIIITVAIHISRVHSQPVAIRKFFDSVWSKLKGLFLFKINKRFLWLIFLVREKRNGSDIKIAIFIKISGNGFITAMHGEKIFLSKIIFPVIQKNINAMIIL